MPRLSYTNLVKYKNVVKDRSDLVGKALIPDSTLEAVGKEYGLSRERVRQLIENRTGQSYGDLKKNLLKEAQSNGMFRCIICGKPLTMSQVRKNIKYCSKSCYKLSTKYDFSKERVCVYCGKKFFPLRSWKWSKEYDSGLFCCMNHYIAHQKETGEWALHANKHLK